MLSSLSVGDEVALLPAAKSPPQDTLEIAHVAFVNVHLVRLIDQRVYSLIDGCGLTLASRGYIVPATDAHRRALAAKQARGRDTSDDPVESDGDV